MKRVAAVVLIALALLSFSACGLEKKEGGGVLESLEKVVSTLARSQLTDSNDLIGARSFAEEDYYGTYRADCTEADGRDVIFGGASVNIHKIKISGHIESFAGEAVIKVRCNNDVDEIVVNNDGSFENVMNFESGGNFAMVDYDNFTGCVVINSENTGE